MAEHRHKRETNARRPRAVLVAGPVAVLATASAVALGVSLGDPQPREIVVAGNSAADLAGAVERTGPTLSRSGSRLERLERLERREPRPVAEAKPEPPSKVERLTAASAVRQAIRQADTRLWTTEDLNLWTDPTSKARQVGLIEAGERVLVTGRRFGEREEIVVDGASRWVTAGYLSAEEPVALGGECTNGSSVPAGVSENIKKVHAAVCAAFPEITSYGTFRDDGEHAQGIAIDIMVSGERGWQVAEFVRENYADLGVSYVIYSQKIWSVERAGEGWRGMSDRGSATANHYDHVHVTTY